VLACVCVADPVAAHPFTHPWLHAQHTERLVAYIAAATGGPARHTGGNGVHVELDEACLRLFDRALADCGIPPEHAAGLSAYFRTAAEALRAYGASRDLAPDGLPLRRVWVFCSRRRIC
jgi:hemoglobin